MYTYTQNYSYFNTMSPTHTHHYIYSELHPAQLHLPLRRWIPLSQTPAAPPCSPSQQRWPQGPARGGARPRWGRAEGRPGPAPAPCPGPGLSPRTRSRRSWSCSAALTRSSVSSSRRSSCSRLSIVPAGERPPRPGTSRTAPERHTGAAAATARPPPLTAPGSRPGRASLPCSPRTFPFERLLGHAHATRLFCSNSVY